MNLESVLQQKQNQFNELQRKLSILRGYNIEVSYTLELTQEEQVKYAKIGSFWLWYDINKSKYDYKI
ncbi:MAG: hypothetical protein AABX29_04730 [Nanoarchaeota archaeon]